MILKVYDKQRLSRFRLIVRLLAEGANCRELANRATRVCARLNAALTA
jgi:hypothetical protein